MTRQAPRFCLADKYGSQIFVGDRIMWYSDSYLSGKGRVGRYVSGEIIGMTQYIKTNWRNEVVELVTKVGVRADPKSYGDYDRGTIVNLRNLDNIIKLDL